jgi:serine/threonine protein kinase
MDTYCRLVNLSIALIISFQIKNEGVTNEYILTRRIGHGGFSEVRLGKLRSNHAARYAVKVVDLKKPKAQRIGCQAYWEVDLLKKLKDCEYVITMFE